MKSAHVGIRVSDLGRSLDFYVSGLGCDLSHRIELEGLSIAFVKAGSTTFELIQKDESFSHNGSIHLAFSVDDMSRAIEDLSSRGIDLSGTSPRPFQDGVILFFKGPDGETLELCQGVGTAK